MFHHFCHGYFFLTAIDLILFLAVVFSGSTMVNDDQWIFLFLVKVLLAEWWDFPTKHTQTACPMPLPESKAILLMVQKSETTTWQYIKV